MVSPPHLHVPYLRVLHLQITHPWANQTWIKNIQKISRKLQKAKLEFVAHRQISTKLSHCIYNYLHGIYIVVVILSNLDVPERMWIGRLSANTTPLYYTILRKGLEHVWIWISEGGPETNSPRIPRMIVYRSKK